MGRILLPYGMTVRSADDLLKVLFILPAMGIGFFTGNQYEAEIAGMPAGIFWGGLAGMTGFGLWYLSRKRSMWVRILLLLVFSGALVSALLLSIQQGTV